MGLRITRLASNRLQQSLLFIKLELDELNTPYLFDVSIFDHLDSTNLKSHIARVGQIFYEKVLKKDKKGG